MIHSGCGRMTGSKARPAQNTSEFCAGHVFCSVHLFAGLLPVNLVVWTGEEPVKSNAAEEVVADAVVEDRGGIEFRRTGSSTDGRDAVVVRAGRIPRGQDLQERGLVGVVDCRSTDHDVIVAESELKIVPVAADEDVAARSADKFVVARIAEQDVASSSADELVVTRPSVCNDGRGDVM